MDREKDREREERQRENSRNGTDDHKGEGTKQEEVTDFGTHGEYFNHCKWRFGGPGVSWGFCRFLLVLLKAKKGSTSYNIMPG